MADGHLWSLAASILRERGIREAVVELDGEERFFHASFGGWMDTAFSSLTDNQHFTKADLFPDWTPETESAWSDISRWLLWKELGGDSKTE